MTKVDMVVFDFDGTIANSMLLITNIYNDLAKENGYQQVEKKDIGFLKNKAASEVAKILGVPRIKIPFLLFKGRIRFKNRAAEVKLVNEIDKVIYKLKEKKYKLAIISSNSKENVKLFLQKYGIDLFDIIYSESSLFGKDKVIGKFLKENKLSSSEIIYIGDEIRDVQAAHKNNVKVIAVSWGFNSANGLKKAQPDFLVNSPKELIKLFN